MKRHLLLAFNSATLLALAVVAMVGSGYLNPACEDFAASTPVKLSAQPKKGSFREIAEAARYQQPGHNTPFVSDSQSKHNTLKPQAAIWWSEYGSLPTLSQRDIDGVEKFVFFVGYPRSGHSIIGSMMDAHPNMIIAHEFSPFDKMTRDPLAARLLQNKTVLFNALYQKSYKDAMAGWHSSNKTVKGYTLEVVTPWHATFDKSLKVIGDKSGGQTVKAYWRDLPLFEKAFKSIRDTIQIPIRVIHVVRNPYDTIATSSIYYARDSSGKTKLHTLYTQGKMNATSLKEDPRYKKQISYYMRRHSETYFRLARTINEMISKFNLTVLEIHSADFVKDPRETISRICTFLDLPCPDDYLQACYDKAYKNPSKSRNLVEWPEDVQRDLDAAVKSTPFFKQYSFEGD